MAAIIKGVVPKASITLGSAPAFSKTWTLGNKLPSNPARLKRVLCINAPEEEQDLDELLEEFFPVGSDGERYNEQLDSQLEDVVQRSAKASAAATARHSKESSATSQSPPKPSQQNEWDF